MKIEITKQESVKQIIDVELPYYFEHNLSTEENESILFGRISENECVMITKTESNYGKDVSFELTKERYSSISNSGFGCYFGIGYNSSHFNFNRVKRELNEFIEKIN